jgi:serine/threonine-protein kinase
MSVFSSQVRISYYRYNATLAKFVPISGERRVSVGFGRGTTESFAAQRESMDIMKPSNEENMMTETLINQRYQLGELLGEGAWSIVHRALDLQTNAQVALKLLKTEAIFSLPHAVERFNREAGILRRMDHPNIVKIYAACADAPPHYIVMEYVQGGSLRQLLDATPILPIRSALNITQQIAAALDSLHQHYVVHRDLKPSNILFAQDGTVRLTDFGLVRVLGLETITEAGTPMGTTHYIAPELIKGEQATYCNDIWSLGILLAEMLLGKVPFNGRNFPQTIIAIMREPTPDLCAARADCPPAVAQLVRDLLAKDITERIPTAALACQRLQAVLAQLPTE